VLGCCALLMLVAAAAVVRGVAVLARHRVEAAADLAALAAAQRIGLGPAPCTEAAELARRNAARLGACRVRLAADGRSGEVTVTVVAQVRLPLVGSRSIAATARAARLPQRRCGAVRRQGVDLAVAC
jgi:secretion/DNA translocation related TadE-like protein